MTTKNALRAYRRLIPIKLAVRFQIDKLHKEGYMTGNFDRLKNKIQQILN